MEQAPTTINRTAVALFERLIRDPRVSCETFARDMVRQNRERLEWLKVKPEFSYGKDPINAKRKYMLLIDSEKSVRFMQQYVVYAGTGKVLPRYEEDEIKRCATQVMQHFYDGQQAIGFLYYIHPTVLEAVCENVLAAPEGTVAPSVEVILRNIVKAGGIDHALVPEANRPLITKVREEHWSKQSEPRRVGTSSVVGGSMRRNRATMAAAIAAMSVGHVPNA